MKYELKNYSESFLDKQYEIGNNHLSTWLGAQQSPVSRLRDVYSQPDFDPETKFYALHDNKVVGFMTAKQTDASHANMEFPLIDPGHEEVEELLVNYAFKALKDKGISNVISRASPRWGTTMDLAKKYGYSMKELMWKNARLDVDNYKQTGAIADVVDVTTSDENQIKEILIDFRQNTPEQAQKQLDLLKRISERVTSWKIVKDQGEIVGHDHLVQDLRDAQKSRMNAIFATQDQYRDAIMDAHVVAAKAKGIRYIDNFFFGPSEQLDGPYDAYGFEIGDLYAYEKSI